MGRNGFGMGVVSVVRGVLGAGVVGTGGSIEVVVIKDLMFRAGRPRATHQMRTVVKYARKRRTLECGERYASSEGRKRLEVTMCILLRDQPIW